MSLFFKSQPPSPPPWQTGVSLYEHICQGMMDSRELNDDALPDDDDLFDKRGLRYASGALDGSFGHHGASAEKASRRIVNLVKKIAGGNHEKEQIDLYQQLREDNLITFLDPTLDVLASMSLERKPALQTYARLLASRGRHRGPVKFGIALLGLIGDPADEALVTTLGKHNEFTLYAAVYLVNTFQNTNLKLWELAKCVHGWGRIHLVERLFKTENANIKHWLLREGFKNEVMDEYLAFICAVSGDLHIELAEKEVDEPLFEGAARLIEAMIEGGPAEGIREYPHALSVIESFMIHLKKHTPTLRYANVVLTIRLYLQSELDNQAGNWLSAAEEKRLEAAYVDVVQWFEDPKLTEMVSLALSSTDEAAFSIADRLAGPLEISTKAAHIQRLKRSPFQAQSWLRVMSVIGQDPAALTDVLEFAGKVLPLDTMNGMTPEDTGTLPGLRENALHYCLMEIVVGLIPFPGQGPEFLKAALENPLADVRRSGVNLLSHWDTVWRTPDMIMCLEKARNRESDRELKRLMGWVLKGGVSDAAF